MPTFLLLGAYTGATLRICVSSIILHKFFLIFCWFCILIFSQIYARAGLDCVEPGSPAYTYYMDFFAGCLIFILSQNFPKMSSLRSTYLLSSGPVPGPGVMIGPAAYGSRMCLFDLSPRRLTFSSPHKLY
jgi:hypothetical protein